MILKHAIKEFLEEKEFQNISPKTLSNYSDLLKQFHLFCVDNNTIETSEVSAITIKQYIKYCKDVRNNKPVTINSYLLILKIFFNQLEKMDIITPIENPLKKVEYLKTDVIVKVPTDQQIKEVLSYFRKMRGRDKTFYIMRDSMVVVILISTGLRLSEMLSLKWESVDFEHEYMMVFGKARASQGIPMSNKLKQELLEYRIYCEKYFGKIPEYMFTNMTGEQMTPDAVKNLFKRVSKAVGANISAHKFRHYYASVLVKNGVDAFSLMGLLRHKDISTSQKYVSLFSGDLSVKNEKYNPLNGLDI